MPEEVKIICTFKYSVYPKGYVSRAGVGDGTWCKVKYANSETQKIFTATGIDLPTTKDVEIALNGTWVTDKYGRSFKTTYAEVLLPSSEKGVISYLCSLKARIGPAKAKSIYKAFGEKVWDVLENDPDQIVNVRGVSAGDVKRLKERLNDTRADRELAQLFAGVIDVSSQRLSEIKNAFGSDAAGKIKSSPYSLCKIRSFGFKTVDKLGGRLGVAANDPERISAAIQAVLDGFASNGHTCVPKDEFVQKLTPELNGNPAFSVVSDEDVRTGINRAWANKEIHTTSNMIYSKARYEQEVAVATELSRLLQNHPCAISHVDPLITQFETENGIELAENQKDAVRSAFKNGVSIITGGPGTGKTTIINAILFVHRKVYGKSSDPVLLSPTGRAARRMTETTGMPAQTIHSAVHYRGNEDSLDDLDDEFLQGNLFVLDEVSMVDLYISSVLMKKIPDDARLIFVGDADQLPSVGCGNVLFEMLRSGKIPTTRLDVIFRQSGNSSIIVNAAKIRQGNPELVLDKHFCVFKEDSAADVFKRACTLYYKSVRAYGIDNVILLNPYRDKGDLNVDTFNLNLQHLLNPPREGEFGMKKTEKLEFRQGDKVMQMRNTEEARNGDVGYITRIVETQDPDDPSESVLQAYVEFNGDGVEHVYTKDNLHELDLAYCTTVHKSQGSEYETVIMVMSAQHEAMFRRNIIYTGITRAKTNVALITEKEGVSGGARMLNKNNTAIKEAILNSKTDARYSLLGDRINAEVA